LVIFGLQKAPPVAGGVPTQVTPSPLELERRDDGQLDAKRRLVIASSTSFRRWHLHAQGEWLFLWTLVE